MIVTRTLRKGDKPTPEQIAQIREAEKLPFVFDEDCPPETRPYEEIREATFRHMEVLRERAANGDEAAARTLKRLEDVWSRRGELPRANA